MKTRFWSAFALSAFGFEVTFFAMTLVLYNRSRSPLVVGLFTALTIAPKLCAPLFGRAAARIGGRNAMAAACGASGLLIAAEGFMPGEAGLLAVWLLISCLFVMISNVRTTLMVAHVGLEKSGKGNSAVLAILNAARMAAPALGGLASAVLPPPLFFGSIGALYIAAAGLMAVRGGMGAGAGMRAEHDSPGPARAGVLEPFAAGLREIGRSPDLSFLLAAAVIRAVFIGVQTTLFVVYVKAGLHLGDWEYSAFMTAAGVGSVAGCLLGPRLGRFGRLPVIAGILFHFCCFAALGFIHSLLPAMALTAAGMAVFYASLVPLHSLRDRAAPGNVRGEVYGTVTAIVVLPNVVSMVAGSALIGAVGISGALLACGAGGAVSLALYSIVMTYLPGKSRHQSLKGEEQ